MSKFINNLRGLGINNAKVSYFEDVQIVTFGSGKTGKFCYVLGGGIQHRSDFTFKDHAEAYQAAYKHVTTPEVK